MENQYISIEYVDIVITDIKCVFVKAKTKGMYVFILCADKSFIHGR